MDNNQRNNKYIPALKYHWLTRLYDPLIQLGMQEKKFKTHLIKHANLQPEEKIMDLACGTGTLTLMIKMAQPSAHISGLDADPKILSIAREKAKQIGKNVYFQEGMSTDLPFTKLHFHHIFTSLFIHHLTLEMKKKTFEEVYRLLRFGGQFHIIDFEKPQNWLMRVAFFPIQFLDGFETTSNHVKGIIPNLLKETGFVSIEETGQFSTITGTLRAYKAFKP